MAIAAGTFRGGRLIRDEPAVPDTPPAPTAKPADEPDASHKLQIVLSAAAGERTVQTSATNTRSPRARTTHGAPLPTTEP